MPIKFVAEVVKGLFGISEQRSEEAETETSITVERETGRASEGEPPEADESSAVESAGESETSGESVDDIRGIGPTYSERLADIGIVTVGDLAAVDVSEVADAAEVSESRAADWLSQAEDR